MLSGHWVSMPDLAKIIEQVVGVPAPRLVCPLWLASAGAPLAAAVARLSGKRPLYTSASMRALRSNRSISHERASSDLGYKPRLFNETITDTLRWFEEHGYLSCSSTLQSAKQT